MAADQPIGGDGRLLERLRRLVTGRAGVEEKQMVGGRSFSVHGRLCCGVNRAGLLVRVGQSAFESALAEPNVTPMVLGGRTLGGYVVVAAAGVATDEELAAWVERGFGVAAAERRSGAAADRSIDPARPAAGGRRRKGPVELGSAAESAAGYAPAVAAGSGVDAGPGAEAASVAAQFADLVEHFRSGQGVGRPQESGGRGFGSGALTVDGSIFAMLTRGRLVVKLPAPRVVELIVEGSGEPFTAGKATSMKQWLVVASLDPPVWRALAEEAFGFVRSTADSARAVRRPPAG